MSLFKDLPHRSHELGYLRKKLALHARWRVFSKRLLNTVTILCDYRRGLD
jgi:hypothetical protein